RGVSDTIVVVITDGKDKFVLKMGVKANLRNTIKEESLRRKILLPYFEGHLPEILSYQIHSGIEVMKMQHVGDYNFHEVVMSGLKPSTASSEILSQILSIKKKLWLSTSKPYAVTDCLRDYQKRADEIADRVEQLMLRGQKAFDFLDLPVVINGQGYPSFGQLIERLRHYSPSKHTCDSHGDLNADNILVSENDWFIVDWEWTGRHDWIESLSRMYGWWQMMGTTLQDMPKIAITKHCFQLEYILGFSSLISELMAQTQIMGRTVADDLNEIEFQEKLNYMLATYYLRDLNFQLQRGRQDFIVPAIGEAFRAMFPQY
ncbi:MAG: phosphotransferase, partial [Candidatus Staskawiczbacteria bacterium]|nr:phosphotransferase [Candidatus Staskawiczbacteria bacterium]